MYENIGQLGTYVTHTVQLLNCLIHEPEKRSGWSMNSLSPFEDKVVAFDVFKVGTEDDLPNSGLFLAAATKKDDGWTTVHHAFLPVIFITTGSENVLSFDFKSKHSASVASMYVFDQNSIDLKWTTLPDPTGKKAINTLYIGTATERKAPQVPYLIFARTQDFEKKATTFYIIDPSPNITDP